MDKIGRVSLLMDFYGPLLTEKQQTYMEMYYNDDMSLGEIAEEHNISRQAVFDNVKRGEKQLEEYEEKLGLVQKFMDEREKLNQVTEIIKTYKANTEIDSLQKVLSLLAEIVEMEVK